MFDKLRNAFSNAAKSLSEKELKEKDIEQILFDLEISLLESDVASEVIDAIKSDLKSKLIGSKVDKKEIEKFVKESLISSISSLFDGAGKVNLLNLINEKKNKNGGPFLILFVGINGTGKTTTLAKIAFMLKQEKFSVVVAAADTFRAGAIEQLRGHTNRLNLKLVAQNYNSDPAAVARDAVLHAKSHKIDCVLIDTAGRMQTSKNLMEQIEKITKVVNPDFKIFVGDSLAGNDTVNQAREFFEHTKFNGSILTKSDADARGGAALSIVKVTCTPVLYVGVGQEYTDLKPFDKETFLETVFGLDTKIQHTSLDTKTSDAKQKPTLEQDITLDKPETKSPEDSIPIPNKLETIEPTLETKIPDKIEPTLEPKSEIEAKPKIIEPTMESKSEPDTKLETEPTLETKTPKNLEPTLESKSDLDTKLETLETKTSGKLEPSLETKSEPDTKTETIEETSKQESTDDPFKGISDKDISTYSDLFDISPPETDAEATKIGNDIRQWIKQGRPKNDIHDEKPKKKKGLFGLFKK